MKRYGMILGLYFLIVIIMLCIGLYIHQTPSTWTDDEQEQGETIDELDEMIRI